MSHSKQSISGEEGRFKNSSALFLALCSGTICSDKTELGSAMSKDSASCTIGLAPDLNILDRQRPSENHIEHKVKLQIQKIHEYKKCSMLHVYTNAVYL